MGTIFAFSTCIVALTTSFFDAQGVVCGPLKIKPLVIYRCHHLKSSRYSACPKPPVNECWYMPYKLLIAAVRFCDTIHIFPMASQLVPLDLTAAFAAQKQSISIRNNSSTCKSIWSYYATCRTPLDTKHSAADQFVSEIEHPTHSSRLPIYISRAA